ncbi:tripartite tricarboxylate transporter permease [Marihabitans asiaticum]|uniref:Putative tricarboxylic transport membrane protein n=1 Tax=Marihabitans asiaticum TaxID=415218 RepID=A0A560WGL1_9MICO|nr:tripartite tricarboxylate transporter permease [Marihabitans asiaticum]TWD16819.1 putative tricarboxylic transport membrane protein [Marihabitans asiaticum]
MSDIFAGLGLILQWQPLLFMVIGVIAGVAVGAMPGLSTTMSIAVLLPFTFIFEPLNGIAMLLGIYFASVYAGSIPAILLRIPGTPASAATLLDGYPMTEQGQAGRALTVSLVASVLGGIVGGVLLLFFAPVLAQYALRFGPAEFCMLAVFALALIASMSQGSMVRGLISGLLGLLIATVGLDPISGQARFTFGSTELLAGLGFIPVLIGLFGVAEAFLRFESAGRLESGDALTPGSYRLPGRELLRLLPASAYSSVIGFGVGALPGTGGDIGAFVAHNEVKRLARDKSNFGHGDPRGVAAAEAANNAAVPGSLAPTLILGIPGNSAAAVLIGALTVHGLRPGPQLFTASGDLVMALFWALVIIPVIMLAVGLLGVRAWGQITRIPTRYLWPCVIGLSAVGSFAVRGSVFDIAVMIAAGALGYVMIKGGYPTAPMVIGLIVGPIAESGFRRATIISGGNFSWILEPIPMILLIASLLTGLTPVLRSVFSNFRSTGTET